ncbi:polyhomeotic-like protein 1 isoform X2 [Phyllopteryx taeniolatus]|uniref:polyhomeotic-like protein 1 isoform X2 n=1 Tax=Phyllopteryx taeniolatus TaxID=161469 RepID=UPI002AD3FC44|nr:polyhomeotic-like protein 1 isoform X2 [Phyllopteryx taeniolatus]
MDASEDQNTSTNTTTTNGNPQTSRTSRPPQIAHMSLYERQAVQALQALQRQPNAAQYFQQLMLQQQINNAQLHNLAAVQQATLAASRQSNTPSSSISQAATTVNLSTTSAGGTAVTPRPHGPATSATTTALNQSVLLGGNSPGQGQMYLRVNRSLRAPLASQLIFMPGGTATATVTTVAQTQQQQQQQQQTEAPTSASAQSDNDQVQNLALHCVSTPRAVAIKSELPERKEPGSFPVSQQQQVQPQQQAAKSSGNTMAVKSSNQPAINVPPSAASVAPSAASTPALPLSQLLLSPSSAPVILVPTSNVPTSTQGYSLGSVAPKANVNTQTLVVQPLQQASAVADKGPVPIQPKTAQGHRLPVQVSPRQPLPILPAPPGNSQAAHNPPHIPVQLVGARQCMGGSVQAVALAQVRNVTTQENVNANATSHNTSTTVNKSANGSLKRKSDCDAPNETTAGSSESVSMKDAAPALTQTKESAPVPPASSLPPNLSLPLPLSRVGHSDKERAPLPQAVVKPQVLTHLIEGFVIQEGAEPFPVAGLLKDRDFALGARVENGPPMLKCEYCLSLAPASQFRGTKRFCTNTCAKRYNVSCSQHYKSSRGIGGTAGPPPPPPPAKNAARRRGPPRRSSSNSNKLSGQHRNVKCHSDSSHSEEASSDGDEEEDEEEEEDTPSLSPSSSHSRNNAPQSDASAPGTLPMETAGFLSATPAQWSVEEVCRFISSLQGCEELAAHFLSQEIDGQALLLLREDHLISTMNIKLGPALKICASINSLRE